MTLMETRARDGLVLTELVVRYGGHTAVDKISLTAPPGRITALIGPNGAGKTTTFNACTGLVQPAEGTVHFNGTNVTGRSPQHRARHGLGRTFQRMELFDSLTVRDNVALGLEAGLATNVPWRHLRGSRADGKAVALATDEALTSCGISHLAERRPGDLSTGHRRLVELARCIAGGFSLMLLDEPSSGLDKQETAHFGQILRSLCEDKGTGILIVEHDMALVMGICDYIYVLDFGRPIFEGTPAEVATSPLVRAAYLGSEDVEAALETGAR